LNMTREPKPDFERVMTTLHCEEPDRVPLGDWHVDRLPKAGYLGRRIQSLEDDIAFWHAAGFDYVTSPSGILEPVRAPKGMTIRGEAVRTAYGGHVSREWAQEHVGTITDWNQFEQYAWPSADDYELSQWDFFDKNLPKGMKAILLLGKIYTPAWMFMGAEAFFDALESRGDLVGAILERIGEIQYETFLRVVEHPSVGAVLNPDDIAHNTGLLVHPKHLRKHVFPWYKKMGDVCRDRGVGFIFHSDGDCTEVMDDLVECGFHAFNPVQPNSMDIDTVKKTWGTKLCLIGNINLDSTLTLGTPEDVRAEVFERIRTIGPGGGYMVSSSNSITDYVPLENMRALIDATFEFGRYPIELGEGEVSGKVWTYQGKAGKEGAVAESELDVDAYVRALLGNDVSRVVALAREDMGAGLEASDIVRKALVPAMTEVGKQFQSGAIYIPEMLIAAKTMAGTVDALKDHFAARVETASGTVVIGTVQGDLHDIGKNLVITMLEGQGFRVEDMGVSVSPEAFVRRVRETKPDILALGALITTTMVEMAHTIKALDEAGIRKEVKVIVGGAPVTQSFADQIGADGYAYDAPGAAQLCRELLSV
jgi:uroporphyrinogen decarboxylase